ncbi:integrase catalytic domain-containing protein [Nephila pilipes]|uniref:Integrase catalytic domain-containing protein n=1 Tax=Nephila pilipes TaxID=299642 RepID=A0A8X6MN79_NEPPI|nr:integrase catalytic domain-containing protein [Nephila pilipes]
MYKDLGSTLSESEVTLRSKVTRLTRKLNNEDGIDKAFDVELLEETLKDLILVNENIHDLLNDEDYERDTVDCEKYFDTTKLAIFNTKRKVSANINVSSSEFSPPSNINIVQAFESSFTQEQRRCVQLTLSGLWSKQSILITITAFENNNSYTTHPGATLEISQFAHKNKLKLADPPDNSSLPIELLIGGDYYWQIVTAESPTKLSESFVMVPKYNR